MQDIQILSNKIKKCTATVGILGLGQVGLPTALSALNAGFSVIGIDLNRKLINTIKSGVSPLPESGFDNLIKKYTTKKLLKVSTSTSLLNKTDLIMICVPTPLDDSTLTPELTLLKTALKDVSLSLSKIKLIIVESTIPPNTMKNIIIPTLEEGSGRKAGKDFFLAYCPERISPGNALIEFTNNDRIIGADDARSSRLASDFLKKMTKGNITIAESSAAAELSKLAENSFRDINIAFANELALICEDSGADIMEVIRLANTHPRVNIHTPGPGVGGPCLPKDPYLLVSGWNKKRSLIKLARETNDSMPHHVVSTLIEECKNLKIPEKKILLLGISYKAGVNDVRYSPTKEIISLLRKEGYQNLYSHDPYTTESFDTITIKGDLIMQLNRFDCIVTITGHPIYQKIKAEYFRDGAIIIDAARIFHKKDYANKPLIYRALGSAS